MSKKKRPIIDKKTPNDAGEHLAAIAEKRIGGCVNLRGMVFQVMYAVHYLLQKLDPDNPTRTVRLEGLEDIDHYQNSVGQSGVELVQVKTSVNNIDAAQFWNMSVLQNFLAVYKVDAKISFRIVYDKAFAKGALGNLANGQFDNNTLNHWEEKIRDSKQRFEGLNVKEFLSKIRFELINREKIESSIRASLVAKFSINASALSQYEKALFFHAIEWSKERAEVSFRMLQEIVNQVTESFLKAPFNTASQAGWIEQVRFGMGTGALEKEYFLGKAARPEHIARGLPVKREQWVGKILASLRDMDIVIIKSSSGQGKSTLGWMAAKYIFDAGTNVYQLLLCDAPERIVHLTDFLTARIAIGEMPLVVIDGLNPLLRFWSLLADQAATLPVKFIVSAREEDWYRYADDLHKLSYNIIDIRMDAEEARHIFEQLRKRANIDIKYSQWQPAWELVAESGLLIEYTYLLTQGQMLRQRLEGQVKALANMGAKGAYCLDILRMVSVADSLGIELVTQKVIEFVYQTASWDGDPYEPLSLLENEYLIKFDSYRIEGLHQVRSTQLTTILHKFLPVNKLLANLVRIIDAIYIEQFASGLSSIVQGNFRTALNDFAPVVATLPYSQIASFFNGLMYDEPRKFYSLNKRIFDEVNERGGIEVFISDTLPFTKLDILDKLAENMGDEFDKLKFLVGKKRELAKSDIKNSELFFFIRLVAIEMKDITDELELTGLADLVRWFKKAGARHKLHSLISKERLTTAMERQPIDEVVELFFCHREFAPSQHHEFIRKNIDEIISFFKKETDTPTASVDGDTFVMEYLLKNEKGLQMNEKSFLRIKRAYHLLPNYKFYATGVVVLAFPNEQSYKHAIHEAHKEMPPENIFDDFEAYLNRIWLDTILQNYEAKSVYEWQREQISLRKQALDYTKGLVRLLEFTVEGNNTRFQKSLTNVLALTQSLSFGLISKKWFPNYHRITADEDKKKWFSELDGWYQSFTNLMNQYASVILSEQDKIHIAMINLKACYYDLKKMQDSFNLIVTETHRYFNTSELESEEFEWYGRLVMSAEFYIDFKNKESQTHASAKLAVAAWWEDKVYNLTGEFVAVLRGIEGGTRLRFIIPHKLDANTYEISANIGIIGFPDDPEEIANEALRILAYLSVLKDTGVDTFNFVSVKNGYALSAFRIRKEYFRRLSNALQTGEFEESEFFNPIPLNVDKTMLETLPEIKLIDTENIVIDKSLVSSVYLLWQLREYRRRLSVESAIEEGWLREIEQEYTVQIQNNLSYLRQKGSEADRDILSELIEEVFDRKEEISDECLIQILCNRTHDIQNQMHDYIDTQESDH